MSRGFLLVLALLAGGAVTRHARAADVTVGRGPANIQCVGTLHITSDTPSHQTGKLRIHSVDTPTDCDSYCGDGVVDGLEECDPKANVPGCSSNCRLLTFPEYGGSSPYLDSESDVLACRELEAPVENSASGRDVTFLAFGDPQYGNNESHTGGTPDKPPGPGVDKNKRDASRRNIVALNRVEELEWPPGFVGAGDSAGPNVRDVRGVIIAGDLTQEGDACTTDYFSAPGENCGYIIDQDLRDTWFGVDQESGDDYWPSDHVFEEFRQFRDEYGLCGNKKLRYPAFEGAGNHDYWRDVGEEFEHPVLKYIAYRNNFRKGLDRVDPLGKGHYSWTWDDVHFVQLNLAARDNTYVAPTYLKTEGDPDCRLDEEGDCLCVEDSEGECILLDLRTMKPNSALTFLKQDLSLHASPGQPVVLISHYPWIGSPWFERDDRVALLQVIKDYNVIALIHGHNHSSAFSMWSPCTYEDDFPSVAECLTTLGLSEPPRAIPVIDAGNPLYQSGSMKVYPDEEEAEDEDEDELFRRYGHYTVIRITDAFLEASTVSWRATGSVCDAQTQQECQADASCAWSSSEQLCYPLEEPELCLPGVTTYPCPPSGCEDDDGDGEPDHYDPMGGWSARVTLATGGADICQQPKHKYCQPFDPTTCHPL